MASIKLASGHEPPAWEEMLRAFPQNPLQWMLDKEAGTLHRTFKSRLLRFCAYQQRVGAAWFDPQLLAYRDYLLNIEHKPATTVGSYLSTLRSAYRRLAGATWFHELLYALLPDTYSEADKRRHIETFCERLEWKVDVFNTEVIYPPHDSLRDLLKDSLFLTPSEIDQLLSAPATDTLKGARDRAIIATLLCTGVWARELVNLDAEDVLEDALQVREGDNVNRIIPYGRLGWGLAVLKTWMRQAGIASGPLFVSIARNDQIKFDETGCPQRLSSTAVGLLLRSYPIRIDDQLLTVKARQLRYMYGYILYSQGVSEVIILRNLGYEERGGTQALVRSYLLPKQALLRRMDPSEQADFPFMSELMLAARMRTQRFPDAE